jgi:hypothetical protein
MIFSKVVSWAPADAIAGGILDVAFAEQDPPFPINLVHPHPVSWTSIMRAIRDSLLSIKKLPSDALPLVPFRIWAATLEKYGADVSSEKATKDVASFFFPEPIATSDFFLLENSQLSR